MSAVPEATSTKMHLSINVSNLERSLVFYEAFFGVLAEVSLDATTPEDFMAKATAFANESCWGTLSCTVLIHPATENAHEKDFDRMLAEGAARAGTQLRILERCALPADFCVSPGFPEASYLKFVVAARD